jgi:S-formylglutathione hydrolase FrmB
MSELFYNLLKKNNIDTSLILAPDMGHEWKLWASYLPHMIDFIAKKWNE